VVSALDEGVVALVNPTVVVVVGRRVVVLRVGKMNIGVDFGVVKMTETAEVVVVVLIIVILDDVAMLGLVVLIDWTVMLSVLDSVVYLFIPRSSREVACS
jgi:hypothetical protein